MCCGNYNSNTGSLAIDSSRGFPRNAIKPDFTAPGVEILDHFQEIVMEEDQEPVSQELSQRESQH